MRNDGIAIAMRIATGMTVHKTSTKELWDVRDGLGLAFASVSYTHLTLPTKA